MLHWLQRKKTRTHFNGLFLKNETWPSKKSQKVELFFKVCPVFFSKLIMFIGCLKALMKCHDPQILIQQKLAMWYVPFWKKLGKPVKKGNLFFYLLDGQVAFFQKLSIQMSSGFLRCNQCIKTLLLSYQTLPSGNFHFSPL